MDGLGSKIILRAYAGPNPLIHQESHSTFSMISNTVYIRPQHQPGLKEVLAG